MSLAVTMRVELPREAGTHRELRLGHPVVLGRVVAAAGPERVNVPARWLGVPQDSMVSGELLRIVHQDVDRGRATISWRTGAQHHPTSIRFGTTPLEAGTDVSKAGVLHVGGGEVSRLYVSRLSARSRRFECRFALAFAATVLPGGGRGGDVPPEVTVPDHRWRSLVEAWWQPKRDVSPDVLSWRRCLGVTARLLAEAPEGRLADVVAEGLRLRGFRDADAEAVRKRWNGAVKDLERALTDPERRWMAHALAVPGLTEYLDRKAAGENPGRLPSAEPQIRQLLVSLRATGEPEWQ